MIFNKAVRKLLASFSLGFVAIGNNIVVIEMLNNYL